MIYTRATLTCPVCSHQVEMEMPVNYCLHTYTCEGCGAVLTPKPGDCCVFCSYADHPCPPLQSKEAGIECDT